MNTRHLYAGFRDYTKKRGPFWLTQEARRIYLINHGQVDPPVHGNSSTHPMMKKGLNVLRDWFATFTDVQTHAGTWEELACKLSTKTTPGELLNEADRAERLWDVYQWQTIPASNVLTALIALTVEKRGLQFPWSIHMADTLAAVQSNEPCRTHANEEEVRHLYRLYWSIVLDTQITARNLGLLEKARKEYWEIDPRHRLAAEVVWKEVHLWKASNTPWL